MFVFATLATPDGPFTVIERDATVVASGWSADVDAIAGRAGIAGDPRVGGSVASADAVAAYYAGDTDAVAHVPVRAAGTPFATRVWEELRRIPAGAVRTYGALAADLRTPGAARAVGAACGRNPVGLFTPCHRVIGSSGALTGFAWGTDVKLALLAREGRTDLFHS